MTISKEQRAALNEALDETGGYNGDVYVFDVKHVETLRSAVVAMLEDDEQAALESRVLAERKPVATLHDDGHWTWKGTEPYESRFAGWRIDVFAHPTPDDASLVPVNVWILPDPLSVREGAFEYSGLFLTRSPGVAERNNGERLYRKAAIDRAMQDKEKQG